MQLVLENKPLDQMEMGRGLSAQGPPALPSALTLKLKALQNHNYYPKHWLRYRKVQ